MELHFVIKVYYTTKLYKYVQDEFETQYPEFGEMNKSSIKRLMEKFKEISTI